MSTPAERWNDPADDSVVRLRELNSNLKQRVERAEAARDDANAMTGNATRKQAEAELKLAAAQERERELREEALAVLDLSVTYATMENRPESSESIKDEAAVRWMDARNRLRALLAAHEVCS